MASLSSIKIGGSKDEIGRTLSTNPSNHVSIMKLTDENYLAWKFQVLITIQGHGLEDHIKDKPKIPEEFLNNTEGGKDLEKIKNLEFTKWIQQDKLL